MTKPGVKRWVERALAGTWHSTGELTPREGRFEIVAYSNCGVYHCVGTGPTRYAAVLDLERRFIEAQAMGMKHKFTPQLLSKAERAEVLVNWERREALRLLAGPDRISMWVPKP